MSLQIMFLKYYTTKTIAIHKIINIITTYSISLSLMHVFILSGENVFLLAASRKSILKSF